MMLQIIFKQDDDGKCVQKYKYDTITVTCFVVIL